MPIQTNVTPSAWAPTLLIDELHMLKIFKEMIHTTLSKLVIGLVKLYLKIISNKTQKTLCEVMKAVKYYIYVQKNYDLPRANPENDKLANEYFMKLLNYEQTKRILAIENQNQLLENDKAVFDLLKNQKILQLLSRLYLVSAIKKKIIIDFIKKQEWLFPQGSELQIKLPDDEAAFQEDFDKAKSYFKENLSIEYSSLATIRKEAKNESKDQHEMLADKNAFKITFDTKVISTAFALSSGVFLFGGYIYNKLFLYHFGIDATIFFALPDYLTSSLDTVVWAILSAAIPIGMSFINLNARSRVALTPTLLHEDKKIEHICKGIVFILILGVIIQGAIILYNSVNHLTSYLRLADTLFILTLFLMVSFLPKICCRYFYNPLSAFFIITFVVLFVVTISFDAFRTAYKFENTKISLFHGKKVQIKTNDGYNFSKLRIILANSNYYFMLSSDNKRVIIYPVKNIQLIEAE